jgi:hypothetical protein
MNRSEAFSKLPAAMPRLRLLLFALLVAAASVAAPPAAEGRVEVESRQTVLDGKTFGEHGAYELVRGRLYFAFDPASPMNRPIVDLDLAPRNAEGEVTAWTRFVALQPTDPDERRGVALVEISNRGGKATPSYFLRAGNADLDASDPASFGDGLLMKEGLTVVWLGWQFDVPREGDENLRLHVPRAHYPDGSAITGLARSDWVVDEAQDTLAVAHRNHIPYPASDFDAPGNALTYRTDRGAPRQRVPRDAWQFTADSTHITTTGDFQAGRIYELVYRAENPAVVGLGLAAIRDVISYAKYDEDAVFPVEKGVAVGISQTGRFQRHFLYGGFNTDEQGRQAYDGFLVLTAGAGRGSFNHRFAQPSRDAHRFSAFRYPTDIFPFTSRALQDPRQWRTDGLLAHLRRPDHAPKTFFVNTGYEYWGRAASLIHTTPAGNADVEPLPTERIYHLASAQHFPWRFPPPEEMQTRPGPPALHRGNPLDQSVNYRALLVRLVEWVGEGEEPPPSQYPTLAENTLVAPGALEFPDIPGARVPEAPHEAYRTDYGPRWPEEGIIMNQPPKLGPAFPTKVAQVDRFGNERGGVRNVEVRVPLATYPPWSIRGEEAPSNPLEMDDLWGSFVPLPRTAAEKERTGDPRPPIGSLYDGRADYMRQARAAADTLVKKGFLLPIDRERVVERAAACWDWIMRD